MNGSDAAGDRGLQYERTALAHWRTMLAATAVGLLTVRQSEQGSERVIATVGVAVALLVLGAVAFVRQAALHRGQARMRHRAMAGVLAALVLLQATGLVVVL